VPWLQSEEQDLQLSSDPPKAVQIKHWRDTHAECTSCDIDYMLLLPDQNFKCTMYDLSNSSSCYILVYSATVISDSWYPWMNLAKWRWNDSKEVDPWADRLPPFNTDPVLAYSDSPGGSWRQTMRHYCWSHVRWIRSLSSSGTPMVSFPSSLSKHAMSCSRSMLVS